MLKTGKYNELKVVFHKYLPHVNSDLILQGLNRELKESFIDYVDSVRMLVNLKIHEDVLIQTFGSLELNNEQFEQLFLKVKKSNSLAALLIKQYIKSATPSTNELVPIIKYTESKQALLELFRTGTLSPDFDSDFINLVYNKLIYIAMPKRRSDSSIDTFHNNFQKSTYNTRAGFHNVVRSLAQALSILDEVRLAFILDSLITFMRNDGASFYYYGDQHGVNYLTKDLINQTMRFKIRYCSELADLAIFTKQVLHKMNTPHKAHLIYWHFKLLVMDNPQIAFKLVDSGNPDLQKYFPALVSGMLNSTKLDNNGKIDMVVQVINYAREKGFTQGLNSNTSGELINLIQSSKETPINPQVMEGLLSLKSEPLRQAIKLRLARKNKLKP
ncbi:hypothetical protein JA1_001153 [Spathaspora sp. JA1]|nr:hypothetical protein JA1_001153 [Spathaspora sp. JA1]